MWIHLLYPLQQFSMLRVKSASVQIMAWHKLGDKTSEPMKSSTNDTSRALPVFPAIGIRIIKIRWSWDCLIFIMGIAVRVMKIAFYIEISSEENELMSKIARRKGLKSKSNLYLLMLYMMTSLNGNIFRVTVHLCGEFPGHRWIPRTKANDAELWCFLWSAPEWTVE